MKYSSILLLALLSVTFHVSAQDETLSSNSPELKTIIKNVENECQLNATQTEKFSADFVTYANAMQKFTSSNAGNESKIKSEEQKLLFLLGLKFKSYTNNEQFNTVSKMAKDGKLKINTTTSVAAPGVKTNDTPVASKPNNSSFAGVAPVNTTSNVTELFRQLSDFMQVTPDQSARAIPVLQNYDIQVSAIKTKNLGDEAKTQSQLNPLNSQTITTLKSILNDQQIGKLLYAIALQENIISGKNIEPAQKVLIEKYRVQYKMNDVQLMSVILIMAQGKIRGDAIKQIAKTNAQQAAKEFGILMQDLDGQMKKSFTEEQYTSLKADIEKLLKG